MKATVKYHQINVIFGDEMALSSVQAALIPTHKLSFAPAVHPPSISSAAPLLSPSPSDLHNDIWRVEEGGKNQAEEKAEKAEEAEEEVEGK